MERLRARFEGEHIDAVYSSDLSRASTTATAISEPLNLSVNLTDKLREVNMGVWEDMAWGDIEHLYRDMSEKFGHDPAQWSISGSEAYENVQDRMLSFITETAKKHDGETIAVFAHGFAIRALMCLLKGVKSFETDKIPYCDNTAVGLLIYENGELKIDYHSCNSHLSKKYSTLAQQTWWRAEKRHVSENLRYMPLKKVCSEELFRIFQVQAGARADVDMQYAAFLLDEPVGIVGIDTKKEKRFKTGWLSYIHVVPKHRNKSFATQLLGLAISDFRKLKRENLRMELPSGSLGINFMSKCGFDVLDVTDQVCLMEKHIRNW
jgi:probable phosphoglycerate mutase